MDWFRAAQIPGASFARTTRLFSVAPNIYESSVWNLLQLNLLGPRILKWLLYLRKICELLD